MIGTFHPPYVTQAEFARALDKVREQIAKVLVQTEVAKLAAVLLGQRGGDAAYTAERAVSDARVLMAEVLEVVN